MGPLRSRLRAMEPRRLDALIGGAFFAEALLELVLIGDAPGRWVAALSFAGLACALAVRRRAPLPSLVLGLGSYLSLQPLSLAINDNLYSVFFALLFLLFSFGLHERDDRRVMAGIGLTFVLQGTGTVIDQYPSSVGSLIVGGLIVSCGPILLARVLSHRARLNATLREKAKRLRLERADQAERAAADERTRIAGELHDVVAHAMSAMVVQAGGARRLAAKDPARAREAFAAVEDTGREALTDIRRLLGVLRREDEEIALAPQPSLRHLPALVRRTEAAGLPVQLDVEGEERSLPPGVDLTAYRVVQSALGGALEHGAAGRAQVAVTYRPDGLDLEVLDDGNGARPLTGVRERVSLYGGQLHAGLRRGGGHRVRARLPVGGAS